MVDHLAEPANSAVSAHKRRFDIHTFWSDGLLVLSVSGEVDIVTAPRLAEAVCNALKRAPAGLVVDLTEVSFLASVGMSALVAAREAADAMSVRFGIVADGAATSRPIRLLGIDAFLVLYPTLGDAMRQLGCW